MTTMHNSTRSRRLRRSAPLLAACVAVAALGVTGVADQPAAGTPSPFDAAEAVFGAYQSDGTPVRGIAATPTGQGYWVVSEGGTVSAFGDAQNLGDVAGQGRGAITTIAAAPTGVGYWLATGLGEVFAFGSATDFGDLARLGIVPDVPVLGMTPLKSGRGYWLLGGDGGIFSFGSAGFFGSTGGAGGGITAPVVDMAPTPTDAGYWLTGTDGNIYPFGDARQLGNLPQVLPPGTVLDQPVIGITPSATGGGYLLVASDGGIFAFGDVPFLGSLGGQGFTNVTGVATNPVGPGYWMVTTDGRVAPFTGGPDRGLLAEGTAPFAPPGGGNTELAIAKEMFDKLNLERAARGLVPLAWDPELQRTALSWSKTMPRVGFKHQDVQGLLNSFGGQYLAMGENLFRGTGSFSDSGSGHVALMQSDGHRKAMLETAYSTVGIAAFCDGGQLWVTQHFGRPAVAGTPTFQGPVAANPLTQDDSGGTRC